MDVNITELIDIIYNDTSSSTVPTSSLFSLSSITSTTSLPNTPNETIRGHRNAINSATPPWVVWFSSGRVQIPLYATILLLAVIGNGLVILTLVQNRRMRTITNVFLLNLAVSDILLGVLCMPFTLIGSLLRDFVFGEIMCKFLPYLQGKWKGNGSAIGRDETGSSLGDWRVPNNGRIFSHFH